ncbi:unnamed protein product [Pleuronectes platessa]|uniref:Uncharacterized protein n=1 Tax=Pleuronectes platessa TaxID=8262 RepID=A0A9N7TRR1_PLEPL|nr:unnamed protein product [Pleuronectes platessa]
MRGPWRCHQAWKGGEVTEEGERGRGGGGGGERRTRRRRTRRGGGEEEEEEEEERRRREEEEVEEERMEEEEEGRGVEEGGGGGGGGGSCQTIPHPATQVNTPHALCPPTHPSPSLISVRPATHPSIIQAAICPRLFTVAVPWKKAFSPRFDSPIESEQPLAEPVIPAASLHGGNQRRSDFIQRAPLL